LRLRARRIILLIIKANLGFNLVLVQGGYVITIFHLQLSCMGKHAETILFQI
jgi:hypothetical protein